MKLPRMPRRLALLVFAACALAQSPIPPPTEEDPYAGLPPKRAALERMLSERGDETTFEKAVAAAIQQGVHESAILEARFLYLVDKRYDAKIAALLPQLLERRDTYRLEHSEIY